MSARDGMQATPNVVGCDSNHYNRILYGECVIFPALPRFYGSRVAYFGPNQLRSSSPIDTNMDSLCECYMEFSMIHYELSLRFWGNHLDKLWCYSLLFMLVIVPDFWGAKIFISRLTCTQGVPQIMCFSSHWLTYQKSAANVIRLSESRNHPRPMFGAITIFGRLIQIWSSHIDTASVIGAKLYPTNKPR